MVTILIAALFVIIGILIKYGRMHYLIAGYNTMSPEEQAKYDIEGIASVFRNAFFAMAIMVLILPLFPFGLNESTTHFVSIMLSVFIGVIYIVVRINSKQLKKE